MHDLLVSVIAFLVLIGIMVVVHELGHFIVAKLCGVRVEAFSFGFGPRLIGFKYGETDYRICLLPFGGYVKMSGENAEQNLEAPGSEPAPAYDANDSGSLLAKTRWQRMLIAFAGPAANFVLAFVVMVIYFAWINEVPAVRPTVLEWVGQGTAAQQAGLKPGDRIAQIGNQHEPDLETVIEFTRDHAGQQVPLTVERNGQQVSAQLTLPAKGKGKLLDLTQGGLYLHYLETPINVDQVNPGSPADKAGLQAGDQILALDGNSFHTLDPVHDYLQAGHGKPVAVMVRRKSLTLNLSVTPAQIDGNWAFGFLSTQPSDPPMQPRPMHLIASIPQAADFCTTNSLLIVDVLKKLFTHQASVKQLSGPIGIARVAGQAAETQYWYPKFGLAAGISLNLGILNLLPFPILDGGMILFLLIESRIRRDIGMEIKERIYQVAFFILMAFFAYVIFNDITRLPIFTHGH